jgi:hypothetical protein
MTKETQIEKNMLRVRFANVLESKKMSFRAFAKLRGATEENLKKMHKAGIEGFHIAQIDINNRYTIEQVIERHKLGIRDYLKYEYEQNK